MRVDSPTQLHAVPAGALDSRPCKEPQCEREALAVAGPYRGLCEIHKEEKRELLRAANRGGRFEQKARALVPLARKLDKSLGKYRPARAELSVAMEAWALAVEELSAP